MLKGRCERLWLGLGLLLLVCPVQVIGQSTECTARELKEASLPLSEPVHDQAIALADILNKKGVLVKCILGSKMVGTFEGQTGAALFRSDRGSFEVLFLPEPQTFDRLKIIERRDGGRYLYQFKGPPQPWPANLIDSASRTFFIKNRNMLFVVAKDAALAATLQEVVRSVR
jgi:hypothetical protein